MNIKNDIRILGTMAHEGYAETAYQIELIKPLRNNNWQEAINISDKHIKGNESDHYPYSMMAQFYYNLSNYEKAIEYANKSLSCVKDWSPAIRTLILAYNKMGNIKEAYNSALKAIKIYEENPPTNLSNKTIIFFKIMRIFINILSFIPGLKRLKEAANTTWEIEYNGIKRFHEWTLGYVLWCKKEHPEII
jgi:tetratricopeptide (TPR) repeat protein